MKNLGLQSEKYSASGNMAADGFKKLLGAPSMDLLRTMIREAIQNSCDAAKNSAPTMLFCLRELKATEIDILDTVVLVDLPKGGRSGEGFEQYRNREQRWVLDICDFGTTGLTGPVRADKVPEECEDTDFVDFTRNIGSRRDTHEGGGTYGYGKSSLYLASACSTILVDSSSTFLEQDVRRFIGCHLGEAFQYSDGSGFLDRYTGRHWWGNLADDGVADPVEGLDAETLARQLGMPDRSGGKKGTTITIVDPVFMQGDEPETADNIIRIIHETVLWYFWPRMMKTTAISKKLTVNLQLNDKKWSTSDPEEFPPLDLYCAAMNKIREKRETELIWAQRPKKLLGKLAFSHGMCGTRKRLLNRDLTEIPGNSHHIALMRPVELVVKYMKGEALPSDAVEWAGVFVCDHGVESAFAASEPPAHDDWMPNILPKGHEKTFVTVALRDLDKFANSGGKKAVLSSGEGKGPSVARVASTLGRFLAQVADGSYSVDSRGFRGSTAAKKQMRFSRPESKGLKLVDGQKTAVFEFEIVAGHTDLSLELQPVIIMDGGSRIADSTGFDEPVVMSWMLSGSDISGSGSYINIPKDKSGKIISYVLLPGNYAVTLDVHAEV